MIETLQCFKEGEPETPPRGHSKLFERFFEDNPVFQIDEEIGENFYKEVRCGILHQAETKKGWKICRHGPVVSVGTKTINATKFLRELKNSLDKYCEDLKATEWDEPDGLWCNFLQKMHALIKNCGV